MVDQASRNLDKNSTGSTDAGGYERAASSAKSVADQALSAGRDLKNKAAEAADTSVDAIKEQAAEFAEAARTSHRTPRTGSKKRSMARKRPALNMSAPWLRPCVGRPGNSTKTCPLPGPISQGFARRQPTAFLGITVLAGCGAVRFLKSSAEATRNAGSNERNYGGDETAAGERGTRYNYVSP
jgi:hypothetical protein